MFVLLFFVNKTQNENNFEIKINIYFKLKNNNKKPKKFVLAA